MFFVVLCVLSFTVESCDVLCRVAWCGAVRCGVLCAVCCVWCGVLLFVMRRACVLSCVSCYASSCFSVSYFAFNVFVFAALCVMVLSIPFYFVVLVAC